MGESASALAAKPGASPTAEIARSMVAIYKDQFGRGPVKARSHWAGSDTLVCTLEDSLTSVERSLRAMGEQQRLREMRMFFQQAAIDDFVESVERLTGRTVRSFVSGMDVDQDVAVEVFIFYPRGEDGPSRGGSVPDA